MIIDFLAQTVPEPVADGGPFVELAIKFLNVLAFLVPVASVAALLFVGGWLGLAYMDPSQDESKPKKALLWVIVGGGIASMATTIINWAYGG